MLQNLIHSQTKTLYDLPVKLIMGNIVMQQGLH